ncbi:MAG TPA: twin-arginine translocation signal domain-containing protein [Candidatus Marinimicrobia bacterium]|nr:twin-arginine translocation signal domain-containing protein [Candidatus Neomarinimicrobiota bacterium]HIB02381.1 twin-arginine translocation signal domain-containing protein [Candidatus Neomarinimicrobiota bacterium]
MPDKEKELKHPDRGQNRRQFLKTMIIGGGAVAAGTALPAYSGKQGLHGDHPELERIQAVLKECGSEFGNIRQGQ